MPRRKCEVVGLLDTQLWTINTSLHCSSPQGSINHILLINFCVSLSCKHLHSHTLYMHSLSCSLSVCLFSLICTLDISCRHLWQGLARALGWMLIMALSLEFWLLLEILLEWWVTLCMFLALSIPNNYSVLQIKSCLWVREFDHPFGLLLPFPSKRCFMCSGCPMLSIFVLVRIVVVVLMFLSCHVFLFVWNNYHFQEKRI